MRCFQATRLLHLILMTALCLPSIPALASPDNIHTSDGWVRASPPGAQNGVAFVTLHNDSDTLQQLKEVHCAVSVATRCELHQHLHSENGMRMQKVEGLLDLPPRGELRFAPGGYHIMLTGLAQPLVAGSTVEFIFTFADMSTYHVRLPVKSVHEE